MLLGYAARRRAKMGCSAALAPETPQCWHPTQLHVWAWATTSCRGLCKCVDVSEAREASSDVLEVVARCTGRLPKPNSAARGSLSRDVFSLGKRQRAAGNAAPPSSRRVLQELPASTKSDQTAFNPAAARPSCRRLPRAKLQHPCGWEAGASLRRT